MLRPVPAEIAHVAVDIAQSDRAHQVQIYIIDGYLLELSGAGHFSFFYLYEAEEIPQVQIVLVDGFFRMPLDRLMIGKKVP